MDFFKSKVVSFKEHRNTETVFLEKSTNNESEAPVWAVRNVVTFSQGILQQDNHICIFSPAHELLESALKLEVQAILGAW